MADEWRTTTVQQLVDDGVLERPIDGNHGEIHPKTSDFVEQGIPFIMASDLVDGHVDLKGCAFISEGQARSLRKGFALPGDVLISHKATMGRTAIVDNLNVPFLVLTPQVTYYRIKDHSRLSNRYLRLYFDSPKFQKLFETWGQKGSTRAYLGITAQLELPIELPPIAEQRVIAHILGSLDDKIELNRRMNETLETIARALFKSWFVDFDPVRAKAEGRDPGLPRHIVDLFPDSFKDSELGEIPKGWDVRTLPEVIEVNPARVLRKGDLAPYLDMANMPTLGHSPDAVIERPFGSGMRFMNGDTLVARITPCLENGKTAFVDFLADVQVGWGSTEYIVLRPKPPLPEEFAYCLARSEKFREFAIQSMTGSSGRQRVPAESLAYYMLVVAPRPVVELFGRLVTPIFARAGAAIRESRILAALRNTLLPKLIYGELRVNDV